ncbi:MAG: alpha/beta hydrolase-fold protein [Thermomicrobiales bacterium]
MTRPSDSTSTPWTDPARFAAHEQFFVEEVRPWVTERFDLPLAADRTAVFGVSAGGELALALGLRHPDTFGAIFCAVARRRILHQPDRRHPRPPRLFRRRKERAIFL